MAYHVRAPNAYACVPTAQGRPFREGLNPDVTHVAFTREPLAFSHRGLFFYVFIKAFGVRAHTQSHLYLCSICMHDTGIMTTIRPFTHLPTCAYLTT
jgi:hypothetical protein